MRALYFPLAVVLLSLLLAGSAQAIELKSSDITQDGKRATLHLRFSATPEYEMIAHYAKNQLILHVKGLKLNKQQLKNGVAIKGGLKEAVNGAALEQPKDEPYGEIRLQLQKGFTPGDAQVIPRESVIDIEFIVSSSTTSAKNDSGKDAAKDSSGKTTAGAAVKPEEERNWKPPVTDSEPLTTLTGQRFDSPLTIAPSVDTDPVLVTDEEASEPDDEPAPAGSFADETEFSADSSEPASASPAPLDKPFTAEELAAFSGMREGAAQAEESAQTPEPAADVVVDRETAAAEIEQASRETKAEAAGSQTDSGSGGTSATRQPDSGLTIEAVHSESQPQAGSSEGRAGFKPGPSYRERDLDKVPVIQREYRNLPFREAILDLVAGTGFNVIVGPGIDNETVYLNFKQKDLSLKSALDMLCDGYGLQYSVSEDAILIELS